MQSRWLNCDAQVLSALDQRVLGEMEPLWREAERIWDESVARDAFRLFVAADYAALFRTLVYLKPRARSFLEWGSGLGVATIMASRLGFDAYGIEHEPELVDHARRLALEYGPDARFATGNFIPAGYEWTGSYGDENFRTPFESEPAYDELGLELKDFDLVYAYPWPDEQVLYQNILKQCGRKGTLLLSYDAREGMRLARHGKQR